MRIAQPQMFFKYLPIAYPSVIYTLLLWIVKQTFSGYFNLLFVFVVSPTGRKAGQPFKITHSKVQHNSCT